MLAQAQVRSDKQGDTTEVISWLKAGNGAIPFTIFIDLETIQIFKWDSPKVLLKLQNFTVIVLWSWFYFPHDAFTWFQGYLDI